MSQPRMNIYGFPHKGLRNAISQLSQSAGNTTCSDADSLGKLKEIGNEVFILLELHAHSEETVVLPALEKKVPGSTTDNIEEHKQLEKEIEKLKEQLNSISADSPPDATASFYTHVANFHSNYLSHMAMEESKMNQLIWANFTDADLMGQHGQIMSTLKPEQIMMWFKYIVPALNHFERTIIMGGFKANAPAPFVESVFTMLSGLLEKDEYSNLETALK